jgi:hypothetical protein
VIQAVDTEARVKRPTGLARPLIRKASEERG